MTGVYIHCPAHHFIGQVRVLGVPWLLSLLIMMAVSRARGQADWLSKQLMTLAWTTQLAFYPTAAKPLPLGGFADP